MTDCKHFDLTDPGNTNLDSLGSREPLVVGDQIQRPDHQLPVPGLAARSDLDWTDVVGNGRMCSWSQRSRNILEARPAMDRAHLR